MNRRAFLDHRRAVCRQRFDQMHAPVYDQRWGGYINATHASCVADLVALTSDGDELLDAACGTGKYWPGLLSARRRVVGADQSAGMLTVAAAKGLSVETVEVALQDIGSVASFAGRFAGLLCVDTMENVGPEDWPGVLAGLGNTLRPGGYAYLTVELPDGELPPPGDGLVDGEVVNDGAYHYYPAIDAVREWLREAGFMLTIERQGDGYWHVLCRWNVAPTPPGRRHVL